ncbi:hypothetical protein HanHA300_Chr12g0437371 [Helianthus annuus]|nr:hypothetical protein HanHA300_Chr12g0437371 [Helianthus annuus]KAJ0674416.1 hypothetical protein HanLR1_Chr12g0439711 [Helianthus annuus]
MVAVPETTSPALLESMANLVPLFLAWGRIHGVMHTPTSTSLHFLQGISAHLFFLHFYVYPLDGFTLVLHYFWLAKPTSLEFQLVTTVATRAMRNSFILDPLTLWGRELILQKLDNVVDDLHTLATHYFSTLPNLIVSILQFGFDHLLWFIHGLEILLKLETRLRNSEGKAPGSTHSFWLSDVPFLGGLFHPKLVKWGWYFFHDAQKLLFLSLLLVLVVLILEETSVQCVIWVG